MEENRSARPEIIFDPDKDDADIKSLIESYLHLNAEIKANRIIQCHPLGGAFKDYLEETSWSVPVRHGRANADSPTGEDGQGFEKNE